MNINELIWNFIFHIINIIILYLILKKFIFKPVKKFLNDREEKFKLRSLALDERDNKIKELEEYYNQKIHEAKIEANTIIERANMRADEYINEAKEKAKQDAKEIIEQGKQQIEYERNKAMNDLRITTINIAFEIAAKILEKNITAEDNQKLIDDFIGRMK